MLFAVHFPLAAICRSHLGMLIRQPLKRRPTTLTATIAHRMYASVAAKSSPSTAFVPIASPLNRRICRRRRSLAEMYKSQDETEHPRIIGVGRAEAFDLWKMSHCTELSQFYQVTYIDDGTLAWPKCCSNINILDNEDTLHLTPRKEYRISDDLKDAFIFNDGVVVAWNMTEIELEQLITLLQPFESVPYDAHLIKQETESMCYSYSADTYVLDIYIVLTHILFRTRVTIRNDVINLIPPLESEQSSSSDVLTRYALSHGLAASGTSASIRFNLHSSVSIIQSKLLCGNKSSSITPCRSTIQQDRLHMESFHGGARRLFSALASLQHYDSR